MEQQRSMVAAFREEQARREQSAQQGLAGLAAVASHESINARVERGAKRVLALVSAGKDAEAYALMMSESWGEDDYDGQGR